MHRFATHNPEETKLLSRITDNLSNPDAYAEYADWLSVSDPETAAFVRAYSDCISNGTTPPDDTPRNQSWLNLLGVTMGRDYDCWFDLCSEIPEAERRLAESWIRPIVTMLPRVSTLAEIPLGASRFLGAPDLPKGFDWPTCAHGSLHFQAQINLHEIRTSVATYRYGLPTEGWLVLFAFDDCETGIQPGVVEKGDDGAWRQIPDLTHLIYLPASTKLERTKVPPDTIHWKGEDHVCKVFFGETLDLPSARDTEDPRLINSPIADLIDQQRGRWRSKLMGYPMHSRTDNTSPGPDWLNLFTFGSDDQTEWSWCDGCFLDVYVRGDGFTNRSFAPFFGYAA